MKDEYVAINFDHLTDIGDAIRLRTATGNESTGWDEDTYYPKYFPQEISKLPTAEEYFNSFAEGTGPESFYSEEITTIRPCAFSGLENLKAINLPNVTTVYEHAFDGSPNLSLVMLTNPNLKICGDFAIDGKDSVLIISKTATFEREDIVTSVGYIWRV